jgi:hypothetical protein
LPRTPRFPLSSNGPRGTAARDGSASIATSVRIMGRHVSAVLHRRFRIPTYKDSERLHGERILAPPADLQPLPRWARGPLSVPKGPGTPTYKHQVKIMAPASQLGAASGLPHVPMAPGPASRLGAAPGPPRAPTAPTPASRPGAAPGPRTCHLGSNTHHLAHGSSGAVTCPEDGFCKPQANKQISPDNQAIMIYIRARTRVSSKTLHDKGCSTCSQGVQ